MEAQPVIRFFHADGHANVRAELDQLMTSATRSLKGAVCFFTGPGQVLLRRHTAALSRTDSFFVTSVGWPTNLDAVRELHTGAPGHVYLHLGGATPNEKRVGRALMHSKLWLAAGADMCRLWVGSHNMTGQAIVGGNIEAGVEIAAAPAFAPIRDAATHLEVCRATAELFDPSQMQRYLEIQKRQTPLPPWIRPDRLLVLHAEAQVVPQSVPFTVHLRTVPIDFDSYFINDRGVRLYLHPLGSLKRGVPADFKSTSLWTGAIAGVVRTNRHPRNRGLRGEFADADYDLDLPDVVSVPVLTQAGGTHISPTSQVVLRLDGESRPGEEVYSLEKSPMTTVYDADAGGQELHEIEPDMRKFFTEGSMRDDRLLYRAVRGVKPRVTVAGYEETMRSDLSAPDAQDDGTREIFYVAKKTTRPADAFIFVTRHVIDRRPE